MEATLEVPEGVDEKEECFLVNFVNGQLRSSGSQKFPKFTLYQKANDRTQKKRIMVAETDRLCYIGTNYDTDSMTAGANTCKYYIGALDKDRKTLTLHKAQLFTMKPHIPGKTDTDTSPAATKMVDTRETVDQLVSSFGSERQKRAYSAAKRNKIESGALETALATAVTHAQSEVEKASQDSQLLQSSGLLPPHNPSAETPQDVYNLNDIIPLAELKVLTKTAAIFTKATVEDVRQWRGEKRYPEYILQHVADLPSKEPQRGLKAAILLYASFLMAMFNTRPKAFQQKGLTSAGVNPPQIVKQHLLSTFTEQKLGEGGGGGGGGGKVTLALSPRMKDKILSHLLVLALILDDFTVDCSTLQHDLGLTTTRITNHFRALGCSVARSAVKRKVDEEKAPLPTHTATLRIPLNFPKPRKNKKLKN